MIFDELKWCELEEGEIEPERPYEEFIQVLEMITGKMKMTYSEVDMVNLALKDFFVRRTHGDKDLMTSNNIYFIASFIRKYGAIGED
ncbi:hypothetical protein Tco_1196553 [Tanacetum coccineum]